MNLFNVVIGRSVSKIMTETCEMVKLCHINRSRPVFFETHCIIVCLEYDTRLAVWLSGNALASINVVALRQTRLVPGWVTVCGRVNHFGM